MVLAERGHRVRLVLQRRGAGVRRSADPFQPREVAAGSCLRRRPWAPPSAPSRSTTSTWRSDGIVYAVDRSGGGLYTLEMEF